MASKSARLVSSAGSRSIGPYRVGPTKAVVVVLNPSMMFERNDTSST